MTRAPAGQVSGHAGKAESIASNSLEGNRLPLGCTVVGDTKSQHPEVPQRLAQVLGC